jgi:hypothetical protein
MSDDKKSHTWLFFCYFGIWLQSWVVCDCKNSRVVSDCENYLQCVIAKICWFISVTAKKKKKNWTSVWLQLFGVRDCKPGVMCVAKKTWLCEASPHQRWLNVTQIPVPGGWQHIYYNGWISLLNHGDTEGTEVPTLQGTTQTLTTTLQ